MTDDPRYPPPAILSPEELARRKASTRRSGRIIAIVCVVLAAAAAAVLLTLDPAEDETASVDDAPAGTAVFEVTSRNHVTGPVDYPQTPPVGGDHNPTWWNCGAYAEPIVTESGVHSLEHGAVWVTYDPGLDPAQVEQLEALADTTFVLVSPWIDDLPAPIVLSAWGAQLEIDELPAPEAGEFIRAYRQAASAPEPGAPCTGGAPG